MKCSKFRIRLAFIITYIRKHACVSHRNNNDVFGLRKKHNSQNPSITETSESEKVGILKNQKTSTSERLEF